MTFFPGIQNNLIQDINIMSLNMFYEVHCQTIPTANVYNIVWYPDVCSLHICNIAMNHYSEVRMPQNEFLKHLTIIVFWDTF